MQVFAAMTNQTPSPSQSLFSHWWGKEERKSQQHLSAASLWSPSVSDLLPPSETKPSSSTASRSKQYTNSAENQREPRLLSFAFSPFLSGLPGHCNTWQPKWVTKILPCHLLHAKCYISSTETRILWAPSPKLFKLDKPTNRNSLYIHALAQGLGIPSKPLFLWFCFLQKHQETKAGRSISVDLQVKLLVEKAKWKKCLSTQFSVPIPHFRNAFFIQARQTWLPPNSILLTCLHWGGSVTGKWINLKQEGEKRWGDP